MKKYFIPFLLLFFCLCSGTANADSYGQAIFEKSYDYKVKQWIVSPSAPVKPFSVDMGRVLDSAEMKDLNNLAAVEYRFTATEPLSKWLIALDGTAPGTLFTPTLVSSAKGSYEYSLVLAREDNGDYLDYLWNNGQTGKAFTVNFVWGSAANDFAITSMKVGFYAAATPIPGAIWLLGSGVVSLAAFVNRRRS